ncbi:MAG: transglutaminase-like domain-containing protein, partial [Actinomycetes bacterium]
MEPASWQVASSLTFEVEASATIAFQVAVAHVPGRSVDDRLDVTTDGRPLEARELRASDGGRIHRVDAPTGRLSVRYEASVSGEATGADGPAGDGEEVAVERLVALRPSRYCPSDALLGFAAGELGERDPDAVLARDVVGWVTRRIAYTPGSSGPLDTAVETLLTGQGVCRDFAHLTIGLARAVGIPARLMAAYAPGLAPMDFHAVVEAYVEGAWHVFDPTGLAPRPSLLRIATGRDAADTAFLTTHGGRVDFETVHV